MTEPDGLSRRRFVQAGGGAVAVAVLSTPAAAAAANLAELPVRRYLRRSAWARNTGSTVLVDGRVALRVEGVEDLLSARTNPDHAGSEAAFALTLVGPRGLEAGIHAMRHPRLGRFDLHLGPVGAPGARQRYEVVVDRTMPRPRRVPVAPPVALPGG